jgi:hypothetical protein
MTEFLHTYSYKHIHTCMHIHTYLALEVLQVRVPEGLISGNATIGVNSEHTG